MAPVDSGELQAVLANDIWAAEAAVDPEGSESYWSRNERTTERCRSVGRARHPGSGGDRPDVPERLYSGIAAGTGCGQLLSIPSRPPVRLQRFDGSDQQNVCGGAGGVCAAGEDPGHSIPQGSAEG